MTVAELIKALCQMPTDLPVVINRGPNDDPYEVSGPSLNWTDKDIMIWTDGKAESDRQVVEL